MKDIFANEPRTPLIFAPTPLHPAANLSADMGIDLWLKRDDLTGPGVFGGNKMRKLEFLLGEARVMGADHVITYGATQSNHAMQTAAACALMGLRCVLYLVALVPPDGKAPRGNMLLDELFGAETHIIGLAPGETEGDGLEKGYAMAAEYIKKLEAEGHRCLNVPMGGASKTGSLGFASGYLEMREQLVAAGGAPFDSIYFATGSAGTLAGILAGRAIAGGGEEIRAICSGIKGVDYESSAITLANEVLSHLGRDERVGAGDFSVDRAYVGPGYEVPYAESTAALKRMARREGVTLDPVYSGKAFAALVDHAETGRIKPGGKVLFWCTGGAASLFAEPEIVGDFAD
ncbi:MAG: pyridoxal-phosphate dependent enzyme [Clostridiales bacterium]|nr:pyridoxal-phosphate dependent enzyme [Clostridiales bacterium]